MADQQDVIQIDDRWYVLATSSRADDRTRVLKHDELFGLFDRWGDVQGIGLAEHGLYYHGTRRARRGGSFPSESQGELLNLGYRGLDGSVRRTRIHLSETPQWEKGAKARISCRLPPRGGEGFIPHDRL